MGRGARRGGIGACGAAVGLIGLIGLIGCGGGAPARAPEPIPEQRTPVAAIPAGTVLEVSAPIRAAVERAARACVAGAGCAGGADLVVSGGPGPVGVRSGRAAAGLIGRPPTPEEHDLVASPIGMGGIALIVHASNPVRGLGLRQLAGVVGGHVPLWSGLGGGPGAIRLVDGSAGADRAWFDRMSGGSGRGPGVADPIRAVADDPLALGYADILAAEAAEAAGLPIRRLTVEGRAATLAEVGAGAYPLARPLYLLTKGQPAGEAAAFLAFLQTEAGQRALLVR